MDKVLQALLSCITTPKCLDCPWKSCEDADCEKVDIPRNLACTVYAMLKAQVPRVMTLKEVLDNSEVVYLEKICCSKTFYLGAYIIDHGESTTVFCSMANQVDDRRDEYWDDYGKAWRCWTSRPTDEQREAISWE